MVFGPFIFRHSREASGLPQEELEADPIVLVL